MRRLDTVPRRGALARANEVRRAKRVLWRAGCLALVVLLGGCGGHRPSRPPPTVGVVTVEPQAVTLTTELPGRTSPYEVADVRPQVGGVIKARLFDEGSIVHAGQVLYQIEPAPFQAAYDQATALLASAQANLVTTRLKAQRYADLSKLHAVSSQDADDAEAAFKQAEATVQQDRAAAEAARINLDFTRVTAPITGRIGISTVTKGALVVGANGLVEQRQLQVAQTVGNRWLVTSGLAPGERVIVEGTQAAEPGTRVRAVPADNLQ
jgi:membrane fusion protein (multidrug efflux system)